MKRNCLVLIFLFMLLLTAGAFAQSGDVTVKISHNLMGDPDVDQGAVWSNNDKNFVEYWVTNSHEIMGLSLGFNVTSTIAGFSWSNTWGTKPAGPNKYVTEYGDFVGGMDNALKFTSTLAPGWPAAYLIGGAATPVSEGGYPIPPHAGSTLAWSMRLVMPAGDDGQFCIKPAFIPPAGSWKMDYGTVVGYVMPSFNGKSTGTDPFAPICDPEWVCFNIHPRPCQGPVITGPGATVNSSHSGFSYTFSKTAGEVAPSTWSPAPTAGSFAGDVFTLAPGPCPVASTEVTVYATNGCPTTTSYTFTINWTNATPDIDCLDPVSVPMASPLTKTFTATDADPGDAASLVWAVTATGASGPYNIDPNTGVFNYTPATDGVATFDITATDVCGAVDHCEFVVTAVPIRFNVVQIPKMGEEPDLVYQGTYVNVPVIMGLTAEGLRFAGFNLLIFYDASALSFVSAKIGETLAPCSEGPDASGWEYFTYRFGADGNCGGPCPSGLLRVIAMAETNNGPNHPGCGDEDPYEIGEEVLTYLKFYVSNNRTFECQYTEIGFAWIECGDNSFSDTTGNKLYIAAPYGAHTFEWDKYTLDEHLNPCEPYPNTTGIVYGGFCVPDCEVDENKPVYEEIYFMNGGIDIACAEAIDKRGDINLNGIANEIADAVLFTNYFLKGISAFYDTPYSARKVQGKVAATDVNNDGKVLTVGDLVYLLRVIASDAIPYPKLSPFANGATVNFVNGSVSTVSGDAIGAVYATFAIKGAYSVSSTTNMQVESGEVDGELKVLVYSGVTDLSNRIPAGTNELFAVSGDVELKSVEAADFNGNMLNTRINKIALPTSFALSQNVPNPFNPTTKLGFALPVQSDWTLSIYNVAGQLVQSFSGSNIGNVSVEWDASTAPSGVYFYKLNAGSFSDTKKMVLMK